MLVQGLGRIQRLLGHAVETIGGVQAIAHELAQLVALVRQQHAGLLTIRLRELAGVLVQIVPT